MNEQVLLEARRLIAGFLRDRRKELCLTQVQLAQRTGLTEQTINRLEQAKFWPGMKQYLLICEALHLFPAIATYEEDSDLAESMRQTWKAHPAKMTIEQALDLKEKRNLPGAN